MERNYNTATYQEDIEAIRQSNKINEEDMALLTKYMVVSKLAGNKLEGETYNDILEKIKTIKQSNGDKTQGLKLEQEAATARLSSILTVTLLQKKFIRINNKDCFAYTVIFKNTSSKNIKMIIGSISINDLLDKEIKKVEIIFDETLKTISTKEKLYSVEYEQGNENDKRLRLKELIDLRVEWNPAKIIFDDGTVAE